MAKAEKRALITGVSDYLLLKLLEEEKIDEFNKIREEEDSALYLRKVNLSGKNLRGVDLHEADLSETKLIGSVLTMANLNGAKLKDADLGGADLRSADFYGASLSGANLARADLRGADLKGMIDFTGANLTGADVRGVDLTGMVNFAGAKLHDVDFTGSATDKGLINFAGADIRNAKGLPILQERNEYLKALKSFSESVTQQFKAFDIPVERVSPIEESVNNLVEEVRHLREPHEIDEIKKKEINSKFVDMVQRVISALAMSTKKVDTPGIFRPLAPFAKITGEVSQIVESIRKVYDITSTGSEKEIEPPIDQHTGPSTQPVKKVAAPVFLHPTGSEKEIEPPIDQHTGPSPQPVKRVAAPVFLHPTGSETKIEEDLKKPAIQQPLTSIPLQTVFSLHHSPTFSRSPIPSPYTSDQAPTTAHQHMASVLEKKQQRQFSNIKLIIPIVAVIISSILAYVFFTGIIIHPQPTNHAIVRQSSLTSQGVINNTNYLPSAIDQSVTTNTNTPVNITLEGSDPDKTASLTAAIVKNPSHGTLSSINEVTGIVTYTPDPGFSGRDKFTFKVNNDRVDSKNIGTGSITINQFPLANHPPSAIDQSVTTNTNTPVNITLEGSDPDKTASLTAAIVKNPSHGTLSSINEVTGIVTYTPNVHFTGYDSFSFKVNDGKMDSNNATVNIRVG